MNDYKPAENTAQEIAEWFLAWAEYKGEVLTVGKLHNLLYFAQGHALATTGQPLFDDVIYAVEHGAFIPTVELASTKPE